MIQTAPILIIGMARAGTTLVSHILGSLPDVHIEVEPHALWKSGNFKYFNDEQYDITDSIVKNIRTKLTKNLAGKRLIEKSPINCLRPGLVHAVFPEAKIVYVERDPVRCIYSNYSRSTKKDSFKLSIILKKYLLYTGSKDLEGAISSRKIFDQISVKEMPDFIRYVTKMFQLRKAGLLPFGPKIENFENIVRTKGILAFHAEVYKAAMRYKERYKELYGNSMEVFKLENIMTDKMEIERMIRFSQLPYNAGLLEKIYKTFDAERVKKARVTNDIDNKIIALLQ